jgi:hypothetical protein
MDGESKALAFSYRESGGFLQTLNRMNALDRNPAPAIVEISRHKPHYPYCAHFPHPSFTSTWSIFYSKRIKIGHGGKGVIYIERCKNYII